MACGTELRRLAPGDFFGEGGLLTGEGEPGTIRALTPVVAYEITQEGLAPLLRDRPGIAEELGTLLARRTASERHRLEQGHGQVAASAPGLAARIRHLFDLRPCRGPSVTGVAIRFGTDTLQQQAGGSSGSPIADIIRSHGNHPRLSRYRRCGVPERSRGPCAQPLARPQDRDGDLVRQRLSRDRSSKATRR